MNEIIINEKRLKCVIERKNIKKIYIKYKDNIIYIKVPNKVKDSEIRRIIQDNYSSLEKMINKIDNKIKYTYANGSEISFYGKKYKIIYSDEILIRGEYMYLLASNPLESYEKLAKKYGQIFYKERINYFIQRFNLPYIVKSIVIRNMKTRYGVCNIRDKKISFQTHLAVYPLECIDYVIVHELTHFKVQNHSKDFYNEIRKILPNYKLVIKELKEIY